MRTAVKSKYTNLNYELMRFVLAYENVTVNCCFVVLMTLTFLVSALTYCADRYVKESYDFVHVHVR